ncbi:MAG: Gfo/Idh/MocA family oxidoreductase [Phycisphaerae bacterium]
MQTLPHTPRLAVVGYGMAGRLFHSYLIGLTPGLKLAGIASRDAETRDRIQAERGCHAYESFEQVLADDAVDAVVLASPSHLHGEQAVAALQAGKHVVVDKPIARNLAECDAMLAAAEAAGRGLVVFHNRRWDGDFLTVKHLMTDGELAHVRRVEMTWSQTRMPGGWRGRAEAAGGRVYDLGSHMLDQLLLLFPQPVQSVYARLQHDSPEHDVESDAVIVVGFEDGATGIVRTGALGFVQQPRFLLAGLDGGFVKYGLDPQEAAMKAGDIDAAVENPAAYGTLNTTGKPADEQRIPTLPGRWRSFYEGVADYLTGRGPNPVPPATVRRTTAVLDAVFASAAAGEAIRGQAVRPAVTA